MPGSENTFYFKPGAKKGKFQRGIKCYNYDKEGHLASECYRPKKDNNGAGGRESSRTHHILNNKENTNPVEVIEFNVCDRQAFITQSDL